MFRGLEADLIDVVVCMPTFLFPPLQGMYSYPRRPVVTRSPRQNVLGPCADGDNKRNGPPAVVAVAVHAGEAIVPGVDL